MYDDIDYGDEELEDVLADFAPLEGHQANPGPEFLPTGKELLEAFEKIENEDDD